MVRAPHRQSRVSVSDSWSCFYSYSVASLSFRSLLPCFCFYSRAGPSCLFSYVVVTIHLTKDDSFDCDRGLHYACDGYGLDSDWDYGLVLVI